ncbi:MAG: PAS domain S-box protein, partial [Cyanobacteria bacterium J06636_16]
AIANIPNHQDDFIVTTFGHSDFFMAETIAKSGDDEVILMIRDISDRKQAEMALRNKTEELDRFFSLALDLLCIVNVDGQFVRLNSQWEKTLGYPLADLEESQFLDYVHPDDLDSTLQTFAQTQAGEEVLNFINRYRCHDGSYRWIEWRSATHGDLIYAAARDITERKQTEAELSTSRAYYKSIVTDQTELICRFLPDGTLTFVNEMYCDFFQRSRRSLIGSNFLRLLPETDAVIAMQRLNSTSQEDPVDTYEHQVFAPDGTLRWQQWTDRALFDPDGNLLEFQSVGRDITALKEAEAALRDSEQRFRRAIENAPFPIIIHAEDGEVLQINTAWTDLSGYTHQTIPTIQAWTQQAYGEQAASILKKIARTYTLESRWDEGEVTITTGDGNRRIWRFSSAPLGSLPDGRRAVISIAADMTQYRQAELALRESEARWQFALEGAGHGVWDWNIQADSVFLSPQLKAMLGYAEAEIESSVEIWNDWIHPEDKVHVECEINRYLSGKTSIYQNEHRLRCKDGSYKWILDRATAIEHTADGDPLRMIGTHTDITERKQRELASRLLASIVESSEDAILTQDLNGIITSWNTGAVNLFGYSREAAIGQSIAILFPPDQTSEAEDILTRLEQNESIQHFETVRFRQDSSTCVDVAVTVSPLRAKDSKLTGTSIMVRDITERKQIAAERLRAEETRKAFELLERVMDNVLAGYWDWDIPNGTEYFSPGFKRMLGYAEHELANTPESWQRLIFPEDFSIAQKCFERHVQSRGKAPYYIEVRYQHKNGSTVWVICSGQVVEWDAMGAPVRMIGCHIDMSDRKQAEDYIRRESTFRQQIVEHMAEGLCVCHEVETFPFLHFTVWNPQMQAITGYSLEEINRLGWYQTLFPNSVSQQQAIERVERMQRGEILTDEEWYIQRKDGERQAIAISTSVLPNYEGETYILALMQDITIRKQADAQLRQTNEELARATRLKDEFLANMSHELRTPLNAILGITEGLQENAFGELSRDQLDALGTIERSGTYLLDLINDILDVAKIEAGQIQLNKTWVSVSALCQSSVTFVKQPAWKKDIQLDLQLPHTPLHVYVDERRMRQVLLNLLDNAVKFTPTGGKITLQAMGHPYYPGEPNAPSVTPDALRLTVSDTGIGIARDRADSLFEPFVQIDSALSRQNTGTGLGLALVKRIVQLHGGAVAVTSELGMGSCFTLDLPCRFSAMAATQTAIQPKQSITYRPSTAAAAPLILLAEDNEANIKTTSRYLIAKGYRIAIARTGEEAVALASSEQPQLILMDIQMPQMDGLEAIQRIRQNLQLPDIPIIALTALAMSGDRDRCLTAGADEYLSKPVKLQKLVALIQRLLARAADP